jgi:hypothetical protein
VTEAPTGAGRPRPKRFVDQVAPLILGISMIGSLSVSPIEMQEAGGRHAVEVSAPRPAGAPEIGDYLEEFATLREAITESLEQKEKEKEAIELQAAEKLLDKGEEHGRGPDGFDEKMQALAKRHEQELTDTKAQIAELRQDYALKQYGLDRADREDAMEKFDDRAEQTLTMMTERQLDEQRELERSREVPPQQDLG